MMMCSGHKTKIRLRKYAFNRAKVSRYTVLVTELFTCIYFPPYQPIKTREEETAIIKKREQQGTDYYSGYLKQQDSNVISESQISMEDFNILKVIGRGSYAKVLMCELKKTKQIYAMKVIKKSLVMDEEVRM